MTAHVKRVLVSLGLILVLEAVAAEAALILLLGFVSTKEVESARWNDMTSKNRFQKKIPKKNGGAYKKRKLSALFLRTSAPLLSQTSWAFWDSTRTCRILGTWCCWAFASQGASAGWRQTRFVNA